MGRSAYTKFMRRAAIACVMGILAVGLAQDLPVKTRPVPDDDAPVTVAEAHQAFRRAEKLLRDILNLKAGETIPPSTEGRPVTRGEVLALMAKFRDFAKPEYKVTPFPIEFDANRLKGEGGSRTLLVQLVREGYVAPVSPLATGTRDLTPARFGDSLGYFLLRVLELTHTPSSKWSPYLQNVNG